MTISGQGNENFQGNAGDLLIVFAEKEHKYLFEQ